MRLIAILALLSMLFVAYGNDDDNATIVIQLSDNSWIVVSIFDNDDGYTELPGGEECIFTFNEGSEIVSKLL